MRLVTRIADERRRRAVALTETGAAVPRRRAVVGQLALGSESLLDLGDQVVRADALARDVLADVDDPRRPRLDGEHRVERGDAVDVGGRQRQPAAELVHPSGADPADALLQGPERGEQKVSTRAGGVTGACRISCGTVESGAAVPAVDRRPEHGVERGALGGCRLCAGYEVEVHQLWPPTVAGSAIPARSSTSDGSIFSTLIAAALNSAVPDFGSVASIVSWFVST